MNRFVKNVFLTLMGAVVAFVLYLILFGFTSWGGTAISTADIPTVNTSGTWRGVIFYMTAAVESNMSRYYHQYCYVPSVFKYMDIDQTLQLANTGVYLTGTGSSTTAKAENAVKVTYGTGLYQNATAQSDLVDKNMSVSKIDTIKQDVPVDLDETTISTYGDITGYYSTDWY